MSAQSRVNRLVGQLAPESKLATNPVAAGVKADDDIVLVASIRTPIGRAKRGGLKDTPVEEIMAAALKGVMEKVKGKVQHKDVGDIVVGNVLGMGSQKATEARIAAFLAGFPDEVPIHTVNRQCSSGLQAIAEVAAAIKAGYYDIGVAGGMESMSLSPMKWDGPLSSKLFMTKETKDCLLPMGITSENVATQFGITRKEQDEMAARSHARAVAAIKSGKFKDEIVPVHTKLKDEKTGAEKPFVFDTDDGCRPETTEASLAKIPPAFQKGGSTTAGNASQVSDGAAASILMTRKKARELGLPVLGVFRAFSAVGCPPGIMGIGPAVAIPAALQKAGLKTSDIDLFELNEAFASQAVYCVKKLGLDINKVNVNGGAIALGHPLGTTGARATATLLHEMKRRKAKYGIVSMCIGSGMGAAGIFENEDL